MCIGSFTRWLLAVGFLLVSYMAIPNDWGQLLPLPPNSITVVDLNVHGKPIVHKEHSHVAPVHQKILFIDQNVADADTLLKGLDRDIKVIRLNANADGLAQIADALYGYSGVDAIHIVSHGRPGTLLLGNAQLSQNTMEIHHDALATIGKALSEHGDILLYGCNVGAGETGAAFVKTLAQATGADIAASVNPTGDSAGGGDWNLEVLSGHIESPLFAALDELANYSALLVDDCFADISTNCTVTVGGSATGSIEAYNDVDWFRVSLNAGVAYQIDQEGSPTSQGTLYDPYLRGIYDSAGALQSGTTDDDSGDGYNARVLYSPTSTGIFYIAAGSTGGSTGSYRLSIRVNVPNHAPSGTDKTINSASDNTYTFEAADFGFTDPDDSPPHALSAVKITTLPVLGSLKRNGVPVTASQFITVADLTSGYLKYTPASNAIGNNYANFTFQVQDNGGTANGGIDLDSSPNTITFNITPPANDPPRGTDKTISLNEDIPYIFNNADFGFTDPLDTPPNTLLAVKITTLPVTGTLKLNGQAITPGQFVPASIIDSSQLIYTPAANGSGTSYSSFTFQVQDNGGTANGGIDLDQTPNTVTFNVTAINDAPSGADKSIITIGTTAYTFTSADFGFSDSLDTPANTLLAVKITTLPSVGSLTLQYGGNITVGQVISVTDINYGYLKYTPPSNAIGNNYTNFTFQVQDNGGTANGGVDLDQTPNTISFSSTNQAPNFGVGDGKIIFGIGSGDDAAQSLAVQTDDKILLAGYTYNGSNNDFSLVRLNPDGTFDTSFDGDGKVTTAVGLGDDKASKVLVQADGKIVVAGSSFNGSNTDFALVRYNSDGSLDSSFGNSGKVTTALGTGNDYALDAAIDMNGKIVVSGNSYNGTDVDVAVVRYNTNGFFDTSFSGDGVVVTHVGAGQDDGNSVAIQSDGKIVIGGSSYQGSNYDYALIRYNTNGSLDTSFNGTGIRTYNLTGNDFGYGVAIRSSDGRIFLTGSSNVGVDSQLALLNFNSDGSSGGPTFSSTYNYTGWDDSGKSVVIQSDGKILVGGYYHNDFVVIRFASNMSVDSGFGTSGITQISLVGYSYGYGLGTQSNGKILLGGVTVPSTGSADFAVVRLTTNGTLDPTFDTGILNGQSSYNRGGVGIVMDADVNLQDPELDAANNYNGSTLTLARHGGASANDQFTGSGTLTLTGGNVSVAGTGVGTYTQSGGTLSIAFNANATSALADSVAQQIAYSNNAEALGASIQIDWTFNDGNTGSQGAGGALSATGSTTVTIAAITLTTGSATSITSNSATLGGKVNPNGLATTAQFDYGLTTAYGSTASVTLSPNNGTTDQIVSAAISGLSPGTTYHYRLSATNSQSSSTGNDAQFQTLKLDQTITVTTPAPATAVYNTQFTVAATASSGLTVTYSSGIPLVCTNVNSGATFTMVSVSGSGTCIVQYDQAGNPNYNAAPRVTNSTTAQKANPNVTAWPTASTITYGQTLASSTLSGGAGTPAGGFAFTTPTAKPNATGLQPVTYTPTDTVNYNSASGTINVTVNKANPSVTTWPTASAITYGQTLASSTLSGGVATPAGGFAFTTPSTKPNATGLQPVTYTPTDTVNYNPTNGTVSVTVNKASQTLTVINANVKFGTVTSNPGGIVCGTTCSANFPGDSTVILTAIPVNGYEFSIWGGACSGYGYSCTVTMSKAQTVTAKFAVFKIHQPAWKRVIKSILHK